MSTSEGYRVTIVRHGGFTGLPVSHEADSKHLPEPRASELRRLIEAAGLTTESPDVVRQRNPEARDLHSWEITVDGPEGARTLSVREDALGPHLEKLVSFVLG